MKTYLKVKIKSLGEEARIIKKEEQKWYKCRVNDGNNTYPHPLYFNLRGHRLEMVRKECRHSNIAYGYIRGRAYREIENKCHEPPNWMRVEQIITKFSPPKDAASRKMLSEDLKVWRSVTANLTEGDVFVDEDGLGETDLGIIDRLKQAFKAFT